MAAWGGEEESRKRPGVVAEIGGLTLGLGRLGFHHYCSNFPPKSLLGKGQVSTKGNRAKEPCRMLGVGERNILTPDSYFLRPTGGSCISV